MKYTAKQVDGYKVHFSSDWIDHLENENHFQWYYHQARIVYSNCTRDQNMLEIGIGTGLLSDLLRKRGWNIKTLDIDEDKQPDFCHSAVGFDYSRHGIDVVLAFEVLEHMPFSTFEKVIAQMAESGIKDIYFSLPWNERILVGLCLTLPKLPQLRWNLTIPKGRINTTAHFWELGKRLKKFGAGEKQLVTMSQLRKVIGKYGYKVNRLNKVGYIQYMEANLCTSDACIRKHALIK